MGLQYARADRAIGLERSRRGRKQEADGRKQVTGNSVMSGS